MVSEKKRLEKKIKGKLVPLIEKLQGGDMSVRDEFAELLMPYIKLLVNKYNRSIDDEVESFSGLIITNLIKKIDYIDLEKSVLGFISRTAINKCIDAYRSTVTKSKKPLLRGLKDIDLHLDAVSVEYSPGVDHCSEESLQGVLDEMFTPRDAQILGLYHLHNKTFEEIASITGEPPSEIEETIELATDVYK